MSKVFYCVVGYAGTNELRTKFISANSIQDAAERYYTNPSVKYVAVMDISDVPIEDFERENYCGKYSL